MQFLSGWSLILVTWDHRGLHAQPSQAYYLVQWNPVICNPCGAPREASPGFAKLTCSLGNTDPRAMLEVDFFTARAPGWPRWVPEMIAVVCFALALQRSQRKSELRFSEHVVYFHHIASAVVGVAALAFSSGARLGARHELSSIHG